MTGGGGGGGKPPPPSTVTLQIGYIGSKPMRAYQNRFRLDRFGYMFLYLQLLAGGKFRRLHQKMLGLPIVCQAGCWRRRRVEGYGCEGDIYPIHRTGDFWSELARGSEGDLSTRGGDLRVLFQPTCAGDFGS